MDSAATNKPDTVPTPQNFVQRHRRSIRYLSAGLATASGTLSVISSATQELHGYTIGFGIGAGLCSNVAGSVGLYDEIHKQSSRNKDEAQDQNEPDLERDSGSIPLVSLRLPSTLGNGTFGDAEVSTGIATGIEQKSIRSRRSPQETVLFSKPYTTTRPSGLSTKRRRPKPLQTSVAHFKDMKGTAATTNFRNLNLLPDLALEIVEIAKTAKTNKGILQSLAKEAYALAQATTDLCKQHSDIPSLQSDIDMFVRALQEVRDFAAARGTLELSPVVDIDRPVLQVYRETLITARRQLTASGLRASEVEEITSRPRASSPAGFDSTDGNDSLEAMSKDNSDIGSKPDELSLPMVLSDSSEAPEKPSFDYVEEVDPDLLTKSDSMQGLEDLSTHSHFTEEVHPVTPPCAARTTSPATDSSEVERSDESEISKDTDSSTRSDLMSDPDFGSSTQPQVVEEVHTEPLVTSTASPNAGDIASMSVSSPPPGMANAKPLSLLRSLPTDAYTSAKRSGDVAPFDVWRSDPFLRTLQHIAFSATLPDQTSNMPGPSRPVDIANESAAAFRVNPSSSASTGHVDPPGKSSHPTARHSHSPTSAIPSDHQYRSSPEDMPDDGGDDKKHVCTACHKRFNRPSSLRIHINNHTGT
ncbi:hypothetical protein V5O48_017408, partial [Marasmius crinis-equi]